MWSGPATHHAEAGEQVVVVEVTPAEIALSALKQCEDRMTLVARLYNPTSTDLVGQIRCGLPIAEAWQTNMNEERRTPLPVTDRCVAIDLGPKKIVTVELVVARA